jgi:hypothetical protein
VPTRKQRRRRAKERRHEWEEIYLDEQGREIDPQEAPAELLAGGKQRENGRGPTRGRGRGSRVVDPPSWRRVGRRALLFAPLMFIVITLFDPGTSITVRVLQTFQLMLLFVPFSYLVDTVAYRMYRKRVERAEAPPGERGG